MPFAPGDKLGPYEIISPIGAGGMGEVYKARDARIDRTQLPVSTIFFAQDIDQPDASLIHIKTAALDHLR